MKSSTVAAPFSGGNEYTDYFVIAAFVGLAVAAFAPIVFRRSDTLRRRWYWAGTFGAAISGLLAGLPDWTGSLLFFSVTVFAMWLPAYFTSGDLIKIRGKIYSFHIRRSDKSARPGWSVAEREILRDYPDAYGANVTAAKLWWLMIVAMSFLAFGAVIFNNPADRNLQVASVVTLVVFAVVAGYGADGSYNYPIARRQYVQFVLVSIISAGVFALIYLQAYYLGRRWPLRLSKSMERVAPPRYWEK